jgi:hypothetical protein
MRDVIRIVARQIATVGDVFLVPLSDGRFAVGQVLETRPVLMNSITCAFFDTPVGGAEEAAFPLVRAAVLSCQFVTRDAFVRGRWPRVRRAKPSIQELDLPYRHTEASGWIGAKVVGSGIIVSFLNAYFGLGNWTEMKDPRYYDGLLFTGRRPPPHTAQMGSGASV